MGVTREYDLIVWGATGYTGRLVVDYLAKHDAAQSLRWAIAGRDARRLEGLRSELGVEAPIVIADSHGEDSLDVLSKLARVVCSSVGPYARHGSELVAACARNGTHYCDVAGEVPWIRRMIDAYGPVAHQTGARLVHCCGFDSVPSDLGTFMLQEHVREVYGRPCHRVKGRLTRLRASYSGGTLESISNMISEARTNKRLRGVLQHPYSLNPEEHRTGPDGPDPLVVFADSDFGACAPFLMASINTRVVRRSNALLDYRYGRNFRYSEALAMGHGPRAYAAAARAAVAGGWTLAAAALPPLHQLSTRLGRPQPGAGPSAQDRAAGCFTMELLGRVRDEDGAEVSVRARVGAEIDPFYGCTARILGESGLSLASDPIAVGGGSWTPAAALGQRLIARLRDAGMTFELQG